MVNISEVLRRERLRIDDPEGQDGLVEAVTEGEAPVDYENSYRVDYLVRCAFCAKRTPHQWGVTTVLADGSRALCGNCCALRLFGEEVHRRLKSELERREQAAIERHLLIPLSEGVQQVLEEIRLNWLKPEKRIKESIDVILKVMPRKFKLEASTGDLKIRDHRGNPGRIEGLTVVAAQRYLFQAGTKLKRVEQILSADPSDREITEARLAKQDAIRLLRQGIDMFENAKLFFNRGRNFELILSWYIEHCDPLEPRRMINSYADLRAYKDYFGETFGWKGFQHFLYRALERWESRIDLVKEGDFTDLPSRERLIDPLSARHD